MARKLKPYKVDSVAVRGTSAVTIYLDREEKDFFADVGISRVRAATAEQCKKKTAEALRAGLAKIEWVQEIGVDVETDRSWGDDRTELMLRFDRWERGSNDLGDVVSRPFGSTDTGQARGNVFGGPGRVERNEPRHGWDTVLPYSEETWSGLEQIDLMLKQLGNRLAELLNQDNAAKVLASAAKGASALMLGPGE